MEAPDKIYIPANPFLEMGVEDFCVDHKTFDNDIEYVRTDAFIEKACEFIQKCLVFEDKPWHKGGELTLKDKVIEEFRKYMKGE